MTYLLMGTGVHVRDFPALASNVVLNMPRARGDADVDWCSSSHPWIFEEQDERVSR